jgi:hypothetical protein
MRSCVLVRGVHFTMRNVHGLSRFVQILNQRIRKHDVISSSSPLPPTTATPPLLPLPLLRPPQHQRHLKPAVGQNSIQRPHLPEAVFFPVEAIDTWRRSG